MTLRPRVLLAVIVLAAAACGTHQPPADGQRASSGAAPTSCRQQYQKWKYGPAQLPAGRVGLGVSTTERPVAIAGGGPTSLSPESLSTAQLAGLGPWGTI